MNIFHCCVQKTASQWIRSLFQDSRITMHSGLQVLNFYHDLEKEDPRLSSSYLFTVPFPANTIVTPLYISFESFCSIPKTEKYRAFFIMRDPRDLVVSWYFSTKYSHPPIGKILERRDKLNQVSIEEGLILSIDFLSERGYFRTLESWINAPVIDSNVKLVKFEDLTGADNLTVIQDLLDHCLIDVSPDVLQSLLDDVSFEKLANRKQGIEDQFAHYRKGIEGDWVNYFDDKVEAKFNDVAGALTAALGYRTTKIDLLKAQLANTQTLLQQSQAEIQMLKISLSNKEDSLRIESKQATDKIVALTSSKLGWLQSQWNKFKK